jgi:peptidoglycan/LPS O-acetylase OafA/YrhL
MYRRAELDWLRVVAIVILHVFHVGMMFNTWDFHIKAPDLLPVIETPMAVLHLVRMPLLMVIAGIGTAIALERRSLGRFASDRVKRLLLPLAFGMFVIVPPQIYIERVVNSGYTGSYLDFYPSVLQLEPYPAGNFSWHHLWFVAYLFVYCMLALPAFVWLASESGRRVLAALERVWARGWIAVAIVPLAIASIALARYPETHALVDDPKTLVNYALLFVLGHLLGRSTTVWTHLVANRVRYAVAAIASIAGMVAWSHELAAPAVQIGRVTITWTVVLASLGWARWYFQRPTTRVPRWLGHAQRLSYPFYILHQTMILVFGYALLTVPMSAWERFGAILGTSFVATWLTCEVIARTPLRPLFGMTPRKLVVARVG